MNDKKTEHEKLTREETGDLMMLIDAAEKAALLLQEAKAQKQRADHALTIWLTDRTDYKS